MSDLTMWSSPIERAFWGCEEPDCDELAQFSYPAGQYCLRHESQHQPPRIIRRVMDDGIKTKDGVG